MAAKPPPELRLIAAVATDECDRASVLDSVPTDAMNGEFREAWQMLRDAQDAGQPISVAELLDRIRNAEHVTAAGVARALESMSHHVTAEHIAERIVARYERRRVSEVAGRVIAQATSDGPDIGALIEQAISDFQAIQNGRECRDIEHVSEILSRTLNRIERERNGEDIGLPTGWDRLDAIYKPRAGDLIIVAARPSVGKTALAVNMAVNGIRTGVSSGIVSLEMSEDQLTERLIQSGANIPLSRIRQNDANHSDWKYIAEEVERLRTQARIWISAPKEPTLAGVRRRLREMANRHGCDMLIVDYLQLMRISGWPGPREPEVARISSSLKGLARELNRPVLVVAQLNRDADGIEPKMSHLRNSGQIEQDADAIMLLHRAGEPTPESVKDGKPVYLGKLTVAKNRNGPTGYVMMQYAGQTTKWEQAASKYTDADISQAKRNNDGW